MIDAVQGAFLSCPVVLKHCECSDQDFDHPATWKPSQAKSDTFAKRNDLKCMLSCPVCVMAEEDKKKKIKANEQKQMVDDCLDALSECACNGAKAMKSNQNAVVKSQCNRACASCYRDMKDTWGSKKCGLWITQSPQRCLSPNYQQNCAKQCYFHQDTTVLATPGPTPSPKSKGVQAIERKLHQWAKKEESKMEKEDHLKSNQLSTNVVIANMAAAAAPVGHKVTLPTAHVVGSKKEHISTSHKTTVSQVSAILSKAPAPAAAPVEDGKGMTSMPGDDVMRKLVQFVFKKEKLPEKMLDINIPVGESIRILMQSPCDGANKVAAKVAYGKSVVVEYSGHLSSG